MRPEIGQIWIKKAQIRHVDQQGSKENDNDIFIILISNAHGNFDSTEEKIKRHLFMSQFTLDPNMPGTFTCSVRIDHVEEDKIYICKILSENGTTCEDRAKPLKLADFLKQYHLQ